MFTLLTCTHIHSKIQQQAKWTKTTETKKQHSRTSKQEAYHLSLNKTLIPCGSHSLSNIFCLQYSHPWIRLQYLCKRHTRYISKKFLR